ncbi:MAG TPA: ATP-binding cassette domain-containing protein [Bacteroidales bacterium]|nr:ATP-binding cassette domain-containing protein [Bacteroidales bacterium]
MDLFKATNIYKMYGNYTALNDVSIAVPQGSVYGLLGPNGAGKTTLIRIINQILAPDKGELYFDGRAMQPSDIYQIGYLPEERGLYRKMKVGEQALYLARLKGLSKQDATKQLKYWFEKFEIQAWWNKKVEDLSKGMAQKIQFIITILHKPKLLIFDEPFSGFDPINATLLRDEILDLKKNGATIIFSTHNMSSVEELCDDITLINKSKCILEGNVDDIKKRFKSDIFEISFKGSLDQVKEILNNRFQILENTEEKSLHSIKVKMNQKHADNELLSLLLPAVHIHSFKEVYPSMNEIFINVVETSNHNDLLN